MNMVIEFNMDNSAFADIQGAEVARILESIALYVDEETLQEGDGSIIMDFNGNNVGKWEVTE